MTWKRRLCRSLLPKIDQTTLASNMSLDLLDQSSGKFGESRFESILGQGSQSSTAWKTTRRTIDGAVGKHIEARACWKKPYTLNPKLPSQNEL